MLAKNFIYQINFVKMSNTPVPELTIRPVTIRADGDFKFSSCSKFCLIKLIRNQRILKGFYLKSNYYLEGMHL